MTEIPEHLLKRSKERRAAIGGEGADSDDAPASEAPAAASASESAPVPAAPAAAAAPVAPEPEPQKPVRPEVAAAQRRKRVPYWAMPVLAGIPLWAYVFVSTLEPPPAPADTPIALGEAAYASNCASCHGPSGGGGAGPALDVVMETWPDFRDHASWVQLGASGWPSPTYGAQGKAASAMPAFHDRLDEPTLATIILYERVLGGLEEGSEEYLALEAIAHGEAHFYTEGLGPLATEAGVDPASVSYEG